MWEVGHIFLKKKSSLGSTPHTQQETERICIIKHLNWQNKNATNFSEHRWSGSSEDPGIS